MGKRTKKLLLTELEHFWLLQIKRDDLILTKERSGALPMRFELYICRQIERSENSLLELRCQSNDRIIVVIEQNSYIYLVLINNDDKTLPKSDDLLLITCWSGHRLFGLLHGKQRLFKTHLIDPKLGMSPGKDNLS